MDSEKYKPLNVRTIFIVMVLLTIGAFLTVGMLSGGPLLEFTALLP